jgi:hypothetical protein
MGIGAEDGRPSSGWDNDLRISDGLLAMIVRRNLDLFSIRRDLCERRAALSLKEATLKRSVTPDFTVGRSGKSIPLTRSHQKKCCLRLSSTRSCQTRGRAVGATC